MCCCNPSAKSNGSAKDPVCGMAVDPAKAAASNRYNGVTYSFCCGGCKQKFVSDPEQYAPAPGSTASARAQ